jgi:hypothetical protein
MDWLDDERAGRHCRNCGGTHSPGTTCPPRVLHPDLPSPAASIEHTAKVSTPAPIPRATLLALLRDLPEQATVEVTPIEQGQRDPVVTGYRIVAKW